jgi:poly-gamma-glutamate synthase PgsB/CapB
MVLVLVIAAAFFAYGVLERRFHRRNLAAVPIRVHVNGTRGKSSVTRLIAAGLRAGGVRTVAKTTGSASRYIRPDGSEEPISRPGPANIREQIGIVARARREGAHALVVECMALRPDLQRLSESWLVRSTVGVITNVRPDHLDVMGPTVDDVAIALSGTVPASGAVFTSELERVGPIEATAAEQGVDLYKVNAEEWPANIVTGFGYVEHKDNVALALAVCEHLGVPRDVAFPGMRAATPDPGALTIQNVLFEGKEIDFVNAFAANDRESTLTIWRTLDPIQDPGSTVIAIVSMRADRPDRAFQFGEIIAEDLDADHFILAGDLTHPVRSTALHRGLSSEKIVDMGGREPEEIFDKIVELTDERSIVVGVGNIGGMGARLVSLFRERSTNG